jgi:hypothetical protein
VSLFVCQITLPHMFTRVCSPTPDRACRIFLSDTYYVDNVPGTSIAGGSNPTWTLMMVDVDAAACVPTPSMSVSNTPTQSWTVTVTQSKSFSNSFTLI